MFSLRPYFFEISGSDVAIFLQKKAGGVSQLLDKGKMTSTIALKLWQKMTQCSRGAYAPGNLHLSKNPLKVPP